MYHTYRIRDCVDNAFECIGDSAISPQDAIGSLQKTRELNYGEVLSWSEQFDLLLTHPIGKKLFKDYLQKEHSEENLSFWDAVEKFKNLKDKAEIAKQAMGIFDQYLSQTSRNEVSIDAQTHAQIQKTLKKPTTKMYDVAQQQIYQLIGRDTYQRFVRSDLYVQFRQLMVPISEAERWGEDFQALMEHVVGREIFTEHLIDGHCDENMQFWEAVQVYKTLKSNSITMQQRAAEIYNKFFTAEAVREVSIDSDCKHRLEAAVKSPTPTTFDEAEQKTYKLLETDVFPRFKHSKTYNDYLRRLIAHAQPLESFSSADDLE